jgi:hypothetical protein
MRKKAKKAASSIIEISGYVGLLMQFCWMTIMYASWAVESGALQAYIRATGTHSSPSTFTIDLPEYIRIPLIFTITGCVIFLAIYFIRTTPKAATHVTIRATESSSSKAAQPIIKKIVHTPSARKKVTPSLSLFITKIVVSLALFVASLIARDLVSLDSTITVYISCVLGSLSLAAIVFHYSVTKIWHVSYRNKH